MHNAKLLFYIRLSIFFFSRIFHSCIFMSRIFSVPMPNPVAFPTSKSVSFPHRHWNAARHNAIRWTTGAPCCWSYTAPLDHPSIELLVMCGSINLYWWWAGRLAGRTTLSLFYWTHPATATCGMFPCCAQWLYTVLPYRDRRNNLQFRFVIAVYRMFRAKQVVLYVFRQTKSWGFCALTVLRKKFCICFIFARILH